MGAWHISVHTSVLGDSQLAVIYCDAGGVTWVPGRLVDLPQSFGNLRLLMTAAIHNNRLKYLPRDLGRCSKLQVCPEQEWGRL